MAQQHGFREIAMIGKTKRYNGAPQTIGNLIRLKRGAQMVDTSGYTSRKQLVTDTEFLDTMSSVRSRKDIFDKFTHEQQVVL